MELTIADLKPFLPGLEATLDDEAVSEMMVNGPGTAFVERDGRMAAVDLPELTTEAAARAAVQIARPLGKDPHTEPIINARLADGSRIAICGPPAAPTAAITICRFGGRAFTIDELTAAGSLPAVVVVEEAGAVLGRERNLLIWGGTGSGKRTLLNALLSAAAGRRPRHLHQGHTLELRLRCANCLRFEAPRTGRRPLAAPPARPHRRRTPRGRGVRPAPGAQHRPRRFARHRPREQRRRGAVAPGDLRHAGIRCPSVDRRLPRRGRRHRGRDSSDPDARRRAPRRADGPHP